jgi:hypothetical protein
MPVARGAECLHGQEKQEKIAGHPQQLHLGEIGIHGEWNRELCDAEQCEAQYGPKHRAPANFRDSASREADAPPKE